MKEIAVISSIILLFSVCCYFLLGRVEENLSSTVSAVAAEDLTVVLDAGHGGEDGGAVASDGTEEKNLNLAVCKKIELLFSVFDIDYYMIRESDRSVGDISLDTIRKRKVSDIKKRFEIVNSYENSLLLSIHQNMYVDEKYSGLQVFYAPADDHSELLAQSIQSSVIDNLQQDNCRKIKESDKSIYLLFNAMRPSVLVECGFMSNLAELDKLKSDKYQLQLAYFITCGLIDYLCMSKD